jgi:hypothetical protein
MARKAIHLIGALSLGASALPAFACDLPKLPAIPAGAAGTDQATAVSGATSAYFEGMRTYTSCIEAELAAAGGESAPASVKGVLALRANAAVEEATAVQKLFQERVAVGQTATPGSEAALRKHIEGIASGAPAYDAMTDEWARMTRQGMGFIRPGIEALGAIRSVAFGGVDPDGRDIYQVEHENGTLNALIGFDDAGKIDFALLRPSRPSNEPRRTARIPRRH